MNIFCISDTHFGHSMLTKAGYRPLGFEEEIIKNWNRIVKSEDVVIHLGDFSLGRLKDYSISESISMWRERLHGKIILVRGNHDKETANWYMNHSFQFACDRFEMKYKGKNLLFSHKPEQYYNMFSNANINIHGHIHSTLRENELGFDINNGRYFNAAVEYTDYMPVLLDDIIK